MPSQIADREIDARDEDAVCLTEMFARQNRRHVRCADLLLVSLTVIHHLCFYQRLYWDTQS